MPNKITLFNQVTGSLFIDVANAYVKKYDQVVLVTGKIEATYAQLDSTIKVVKKITYQRNKSYLRIFTWFWFSIQSFFYLLFRRKITNVLFVTNPPIAPSLGLLFKYRKKFKFTVLVYDIYPEALSNFGYLNKNSFIYKFWGQLNKKTYQYASRIITISNVMQDVISKSIDKNRIEVIYPWVDSSFIKPIEKKDNWFVKKHHLENKKVVLYSGNMGATHDLLTVLKAANEIKKTNSEFHFLFIGDGVQKYSIVNFARENNLKNTTFLPFQDAKILPFSFAAADFGVVSLGSGAEGLSVPSKTFYLLAAGVAIIAITEKGSEIENLVNQNKCGKSINPGDFKALSTFLTATNEVNLNLCKVNARKLSVNFTFENAELFL